MASPVEITLNKSTYLPGEVATLTLVNPDPALYYTWGETFSNVDGVGAGGSGYPVATGGASQPTRPIPAGHQISYTMRATAYDPLFVTLEVSTWLANPYGPDGILGSGDDNQTAANLVGTRRVTAVVSANGAPGATPTIASLGLSDGNTTVTSKSIGAYVQGLSTLKWNLVANAGTGATITSAKVEIEGVTYPSSAGETPALPTAGTISVRGTITTSRGLTATRTETVTVLAYEAPKITSLTAYRSTSAGVEDDNGTYVRMAFAGAAAALTVGGTQKNRVTYALKTRPRGTTTWTTRASATNSATLAAAATVTPSGFPLGTAYEVRVDLADLFGAACSWIGARAPSASERCGSGESSMWAATPTSTVRSTQRPVSSLAKSPHPRVHSRAPSPPHREPSLVASRTVADRAWNLLAS